MDFRGRSIDDSVGLQWLVDSQVQEGIDLEYKSELYGGGDEERRELLRDVVSMANAQGGLILLGITEDGEGIPMGLVGVERGNHSEPIISSCLANIDRRIIGLACIEVDLNGPNQVW